MRLKKIRLLLLSLLFPLLVHILHLHIHHVLLCYACRVNLYTICRKYCCFSFNRQIIKANRQWCFWRFRSLLCFFFFSSFFWLLPRCSAASNPLTVLGWYFWMPFFAASINWKAIVIIMVGVIFSGSTLISNSIFCKVKQDIFYHLSICINHRLTCHWVNFRLLYSCLWQSCGWMLTKSYSSSSPIISHYLFFGEVLLN